MIYRQGEISKTGKGPLVQKDTTVNCQHCNEPILFKKGAEVDRNWDIKGHRDRFFAFCLKCKDDNIFNYDEVNVKMME